MSARLNAPAGLLADAEARYYRRLVHLLSPLLRGMARRASEQRRELDRLRAVEAAAGAYIVAEECAPEYAGGAYDALRALLSESAASASPRGGTT